VTAEQLTRGVVALFGIDAIRELEISLEFVLANSECMLQESRLFLKGTNLARVSTSREVLTSPRESEPTAGASSTPEANGLGVSDADRHYPSIEGGGPLDGSALPETCLICASSDNVIGGKSPSSREFETESPTFQGLPLDLDPRSGEVMVVGEQDIAIDVNPALPADIKAILQDSQADYSTFYASSQVKEAPDLERGTVAAGGNNRPDTRTLSLAVAVALLAGVTAPVQAGSSGPEPLPPLRTEIGGSYEEDTRHLQLSISYENLARILIVCVACLVTLYACHRYTKRRPPTGGEPLHPIPEEDTTVQRERPGPRYYQGP
jgi:hypothetical protein